MRSGASTTYHLVGTVRTSAHRRNFFSSLNSNYFYQRTTTLREEDKL